MAAAVASPRSARSTKAEPFGFSTSERAEQAFQQRAARAERQAQEKRRAALKARRDKRDEQERGRLARARDAEKALSARARRAKLETPPRLANQAQSDVFASYGGGRLAPAVPVDPTLREARNLRPKPPAAHGAPEHRDDAQNVDLEQHYLRSLQELRTRAEGPPVAAFGSLTPRAPSTHSPRLPAFNKRIAPRALEGVGGHVTAATTGRWSSRTATKPFKPKRQAAAPIGTAPSKVPRGKIKFTPGNKDPGRPAEGFTRKWKPAHIDISVDSIKKIAEADNDKRSQDELRYAPRWPSSLSPALRPRSSLPACPPSSLSFSECWGGRYVFEMIDANSMDGIIDANDLETVLRRLDYSPEPGEVEDIVWEVDDDRDGGLTWEEFSALYERVRKDQDGKEPHRLFSLIEFLMFDLDADGFVGVEEAVELFYRRYGREVLFKKDSVKGVATGASKEGERDTSGERPHSVLFDADQL